MKKIRFGITGSGFMGRTHAEAIKRLGEAASVVAIWGGSRAAGLAEQYGAACEASVENLMRRPDIDAIMVTTPHYMHATEAVMALEAGKHVLVEKPMATSVADCDRMIETAHRRRLALGTAYHWRFRNNTRRAREVLADNAIGQVLTVQVAIPFDIMAYRAGGFGGSWAWWDNPASIGFTLNSAPHALDLVRWFTGAEMATVSAFCRTFLPGKANEDTTMALLEFSNGTLFSLFSSDALPAPPLPGESFRFRIMGTTGLMDLDPLGELRVADKNGWRIVTQQPAVGAESSDSAFADARIEAFRDQISAFIAMIHGEPSGVGTGNDGKVCVEAVLAMLASSREKRWIQLRGN